MNIEIITEDIFQAKVLAKPITQITKKFPNFSVLDGYTVQDKLLTINIKNQEKLSGYKMGLTSKAKQRDVNVHEPIQGFLLKSMEIKNGGILKTTTRIHPRVEPEIAAVTNVEIKSKLSRAELISSLEGLYLAAEIVDSRYENFTFTLSDVVADNTSASAYFLGSVNLKKYLDQLPLLGIFVKKNGKIIETGAPAAVLGDPIHSLMGLIDNLLSAGKTLPAGMTVLTGGITNSTPVSINDKIEIESHFDKINFTVE